MKKYIEKLICNIPAETAWNALKEMNIWLPSLSTNKAVNYDDKEVFFYEGRKYEVITKEGISMECELYKIDETNMIVEIHAKHSILKSVLTCSIRKIDEKNCELIRTQTYLGIVGFIFTAFFNKRESDETGEYLKVWEKFAKNKIL